MTKPPVSYGNTVKLTPAAPEPIRKAANGPARSLYPLLGRNYPHHRGKSAPAVAGRWRAGLIPLFSICTLKENMS